MSNKLKKNMFKIVHKATNYRPKPTKPKHIKNVILSTFNVQGVNYIIDALSVRLNTKENWAVVLKALIIVQSCFEEGSKEFEEMMVTNGKAIFSLQRFKSFSPQNHPLTIYITKYARYLEEKVNILSTNGVQYEKKPDFFNDLSISDQLKGIPKLQSQFNALCNCRITNVQRASTIIIRAYILLLRDSIRLYTMLSKVIVDMCDKFSNMSKNDANQFVAVYKLFVKETNAIIKIYDGARAISAKLPQIEKIDDSIVSKLEGTLGIVGDNGNGLDDVDETPEELLPTNKNMTFSQTPTKGNEDKSESDESSSGGNEQNNDDFLIFDTPIVNNPKQFNPFTEVPITEKPNNNNDPFSLFGNTSQPQNGKNGNQKVTVQNNGGFNPFETPKTTPVQQNNPIIDLGFGTKTNIDPFSNLTSFDQPSNNNQGNPFGKVTSNNTQSQSTSNNPFLF